MPADAHASECADGTAPESHFCVPDGVTARDYSLLRLYFGVTFVFLFLILVVGMLTGAGAAIGWSFDAIFMVGWVLPLTFCGSVSYTHLTLPTKA